jgi:hypothetical protein
MLWHRFHRGALGILATLSAFELTRQRVFPFVGFSTLITAVSVRNHVNTPEVVKGIRVFGISPAYKDRTSALHSLLTDTDLTLHLADLTLLLFDFNGSYKLAIFLFDISICPNKFYLSEYFLGNYWLVRLVLVVGLLARL